MSLLLAAAAGSPIDPASAGEAAAGRSKVRSMCQNCHGEDGISVLPGAPNLSGQQKEYLLGQLRAYRSGGRRDAQMTVVAKMLSDADIDDLAEWYSSIKITVQMTK